MLGEEKDLQVHIILGGQKKNNIINKSLTKLHVLTKIAGLCNLAAQTGVVQIARLCGTFILPQCHAIHFRAK